MADKEEIFNLIRRSLFYLFVISVFQYSNCSLVAEFESNKPFSQTDLSNAHRLTKRDATSVDEKCTSQENTFLANVKTVKIDQTFTFSNETKYSMALAWAGTDDGTLLIVTADTVMGSTIKSSVYRSQDFGKLFEDITEKQKIILPIKKHFGLQRNPHDPKKVYLICEGTNVYITEDGGATFLSFQSPFSISGELIFHSNKEYSSHILAKNSHSDLYVTTDNARSWKRIKTNIEKVIWGILPDPDPAREHIDTDDTAETIYATVGGIQVTDPVLQHFFDLDRMEVYELVKTTDNGNTWTSINKNVVNYDRKGKFIYTSVLKEEVKKDGWRLLQVSIDGGKTFREAQLPTITQDRFYSVMDIEDNMIFMHVDDKEDTGHGTLYTSSTQGIVYSESLPRHLYPNFGEVHDFYKVKSMKGVYITSQMGDDDSIHSVITYNRGATWQKIPQPPGTKCKDTTKECFLQIHGMYSLKRSIQASLPLSEASAVGLIVVHAHVADALQKTPPDVYVSSDGGYNWRLSLKGPHHYQIGDHGGLLVAISMDEVNPKIIKFSTDEGKCWHEYTFTNKTLNFTGLLTEPEGKSSVVMIWGYVSETRKWEVHTIDFKNVIKRQCSDDKDYEVWQAHSQHRADEGSEMKGCFLGQKATFLRLKQDSWCYNGYDHEQLTTIQDCVCSREDYECDYGYFRPGGSNICQEIPEFTGPNIDICYHGHVDKIVSQGYRKIPDDKCTKGFEPTSTKVDLNERCDETTKVIVIEDEESTMSAQEQGSGIGRGIKILAVILIIAVLGLAAVMGVYFFRKFILLRRHKVEYRYSMLNANEQQQPLTAADDDDVDWAHDLDNALSSSNVKYQDSDEEELTTTVRPPKSRQNGRVTSSKPKPKDKNPFGSYHDDSDDDMLS